MVTIEAHRNAFGSYYDKARLLSLYEDGDSNSLSRHTNCKNPVIKIKGLLNYLTIHHLR